jgi:hypothetical protein
MKKLLCISLLGYVTTVFSCDQYMCQYLLDIIIVNTTKTNCVMIGQNVKSGLIYSKNLPLTIPADQQSERYSVEYDLDNYQTAVSLSFQCGADKFVTFSSQRNIEQGFWSNTESVVGTVISAANLDASYVAKEASCKASTPTPTTIYWTLHS